jgi:ubiquinone/menaquinone biosynthesis C-methylase UbiE
MKANNPSLIDDVWSDKWVDRFLRCPQCNNGALTNNDSEIVCDACGAQLSIRDGIVKGLKTDAVERDEKQAQGVTQTVREFYEEHPFPNYDGLESVGDLLGKASRSVYAALLDQQIPVGASILEAGCGTGQLGIFLSIGGRSVVGVDLSSASLALATEFKERHQLRNCNFLQADLFDLPLKSESFDLVISKGVLHHTSDAGAAFKSICRMARPGGYVILGLYNQVGRIPTSLRGWFYKASRSEGSDYVLRKMVRSKEKATSWFLDQYAHPHETRHTVDEVLPWLEENDLEFVRAVPPIRIGESFSGEDMMFQPTELGSRWEHWIAQFKWLFTISREGALFDLIAQKRDRS